MSRPAARARRPADLAALWRLRRAAAAVPSVWGSRSVLGWHTAGGEGGVGSGVAVAEDIWAEPARGGGVFRCWVVFDRFLPEGQQSLTDVKRWAVATVMTT